MKISYNKQFKRYVVSEQGKIKHMVHTLGDAERLAGIEPEPLPRYTAATTNNDAIDDSFDDFEDLFADL